MRTIFVVLSIVSALSLAAQTETTPDALFRRGMEHYRAERYAEAVADLNAAAQAYLSPDEMKAYVSTGQFENLPQFETALIYLALAHSRLGNEIEAREAVLRLATAERIEPIYTTLPLDPEAAEFESLAARLVPDLDLGRNVQLARAGVTATPPPTATTAPRPAVTAVAMSEPERLRVVEEMVAQECARIQREAEERIAAIRREADERIAAERAAANRDAEARIAAAQRAAEERIAEIQRTADARVAAADAARREAEERVAAAERARREEERLAEARRPAPVITERRVPAPVPPPSVAGDWQSLLRRADAFAAAGRLAEANELYGRVATSDAPRHLRAEGAVGLYRTNAYWRAVTALERLAPFSRGEEDLRYYYAVSLYETGEYAAARQELACALPFIQLTDDVIRYRTKIEEMVAWQMRQPPVVIQ